MPVPIKKTVPIFNKINTGYTSTPTFKGIQAQQNERNILDQQNDFLSKTHFRVKTSEGTQSISGRSLLEALVKNRNIYESASSSLSEFVRTLLDIKVEDKVKLPGTFNPITLLKRFDSYMALSEASMRRKLNDLPGETLLQAQALKLVTLTYSDSWDKQTLTQYRIQLTEDGQSLLSA